MSVREIAVFCSLLSKPPCFVIPVFSVPKTNDACVQNLDGLGKIEAFQLFDTSLFHTVPIIAPNLTRVVGGEGIVAFWVNSETLIFGPLEQIKAQLSLLDLNQLPVFTAVEVASLVEDEHKITIAAKRAEPLILNPTARDAYLNTLLMRPSVAKTVRTETVEFAGDDVHPSVFTILERDMDHKEWYDIWRAAFYGDIDNKDLHSIVQWRIETRGLGIYEGLAIDIIVTYYYIRPKNIEYARSWLTNNTISTAGWVRVWDRVARTMYGSLDDEIYRLGYNYLSEFIDVENDIKNCHNWSVVWRRMWQNSSENSEDLLIWAAKAVSVDSNANQWAEYVVLPVLEKHPETYWALSFLGRWLQEPIVNTAWVTAFIKYGRNVLDQNHEEIGLRWLYTLGAGSNQWSKLWHYLQPVISRADWEKAAVAWLLRGRKDLKSWPRVFHELIDTGDVYITDEIREAAWNWARVNQHAYDKLINEIANQSPSAALS